MKKKKIFSGVGTALITPFKGGEIDYSALSRIIESQISKGVSALIVGGTTGESSTLSERERDEMYSFVKEKNEGRVKIVFGTGANDTRLAKQYTKRANEIGCDGVLVVTPYYNKGTFSGVTRHYLEIAEASDAPVILYNVPQRTGVNLTIEQLYRLSREENIVAIKEASDSLDRLMDISVLSEELQLYAGNDSQIYEALAVGGEGVISVVSNVFPERAVKICSDFFSGKWREALAEQLSLLEFIKLMFKETNPSPIKYAMSRAGYCKSEVRLPLLPPESETRKLIDSFFEGKK